MGSVVVLEVNEIPLSLLRWYAASHPGGAIDRVLAEGRAGLTFASDTGIRELYPSQTWATVGMGVPFEKHGVYWYGDPKPAEFPLYWQAAAEHRRVGVVNTLHSSPFDQQCRAPGLAFAVPDVFATTSEVRPRSLEPLQDFSRSMTNKNARAVRSPLPFVDYAKGLASIRGIGVQPETLARLGSLAAGVATKRIPKERLRTAQFLLMADVFVEQLDRERPDLAVFFTNHVAAAMHRYWPASFPGDWDEQPRSDEWIERFENEIPRALSELERFIDRVAAWCEAHDRTLVLISSMGQVGGEEGDAERDRSLVVTEPQRFIDAVGIGSGAELFSSMVPHLTVRMPDVDAAVAEAARLSALTVEGGTLTVDRSGVAVTITYHLDSIEDDRFVVDGIGVSIEDAGLEWVAVEEQKAGVHDPLGTLVVVGGATDPLPTEPVDVLEIAPAILRALDLDPLDHHRSPSFVL